MRPPGLRERHRPLDEQLIPIHLAVGPRVRTRRSRARTARAPPPRAEPAHRSSWPSARTMSQGGLPTMASNPASGRRTPVRSRRRLPGTRAPSGRSRRASLVPSDAREEVARHCRRQARVRPVSSASDSAANAAAEPRERQPGGAPRVGHACPFLERRAGCREQRCSARSFARTCAAVSFGSRARPKPTGSAARDDVGGERRRERAGAGAAAASAPARSSGARQPGAGEAVADAQVMVEERERTVGGERGQPQRQPRELHGRRIDVDAEQAPLGDEPPNRRALARADVAGEAASVVRRARTRRRRRDSGRRRPGRRRCPSTDRARAARESAPACRVVDKREPARRAPGSRRAAAACRRFRSTCARRIPAAAMTSSARPRPASRRAARSPAGFRRRHRVARRRDRDRRCARALRRRRPGALTRATMASRCLVVEAPPLRERRSRRREQAAVERRDLEPAGTARPHARVERPHADRPRARPLSRHHRRRAQAPRRCSCHGRSDARAARARELRRRTGTAGDTRSSATARTRPSTGRDAPRAKSARSTWVDASSTPVRSERQTPAACRSASMRAVSSAHRASRGRRRARGREDHPQRRSRVADRPPRRRVPARRSAASAAGPGEPAGGACR